MKILLDVFYMNDRSGHGLYLYSSGNRYKGQYLAGKKVNIMVVCHLFKDAIITKHMGSEGRLYSSKSTNGGKGLKNSKINSYFTP